jgi:hypothetical protein
LEGEREKMEDVEAKVPTNTHKCGEAKLMPLTID